MSQTYFTILSFAEKDEWRRFINLLPEEQQDVYMFPEYYSLFESDFVTSECFVYIMNDAIILYPYLKTDINKMVDFNMNSQFFDIEGAYGYNGIATNTDEFDVIKSFENQFREYCKDTGIIAEFVRFNCVLKNHLLSGYLEKEKNNNNYIVDLNLTDESIWKTSYARSNRKNIKKAVKSGLYVKTFYGSEIEDCWLNQFEKIYHSTLNRIKANKSYYYDCRYFKAVSRLLNNNSMFIFTCEDEKPISCELVLFSHKIGYSYLGGTLSEFFHLRPNNLLKHEIIMKLKGRGLAYFCLGGGRTIADSVCKYKKTFAKTGEVEFYIGKGIHNKEAYESICNTWAKKNREKEKCYSHYFLKYKL